MNRLVLVLAILLVTINPTQCFHNASPVIEEVGMQAPWPTHEWSRTTPEKQGLNSVQLESMTDHFTTKNIQIDSLIVIRNGWIVYEKYPSKYSSNDTHHLFSCTKSVTSTLVGIALLLGYLESIETPILNFFQGTNFSNPSERKEKISIKNLLEMTAGFEWNEEQYGYEINDYNKMVRSEDWVKYVLDKQMKSEPGTTFLYNSGASHILSAIIQAVTHDSTLDFAIANLFHHLGINNYEWGQDPQGVYSGASNLKLKPTDMAKIGYLYLRNGLWDGIQIVPQEWVQMTSTSQVHVDESLDYSYQWWVLSEIGAYYALGWGYQSITVVPDYELVIVVTAATLDSSVEVEYILKKWILPSLGLNSTIRTSYTISPLLVLLGGSPFIVMAIAYFMDLKGLWNIIENNKIETDR
jgi:CubicO group peptidase (beta-lactamase class C family)